jgi:hypothetical protein
MKPTIRVNGAARQIMGDLMWAKMRAVSENNNYVIAFGSAGPDLSNDTYYIYDDDDGDLDLTDLDNETDKLVKTVVISDEYKEVGFGYVSGITKTDNSTTLSGDAVTFIPASGIIWFRFEPNGRSNKNGGIYLILDEDETNGSTERSRAVTVIQTGRVRIYNYNEGDDKWK